METQLRVRTRISDDVIKADKLNRQVQPPSETSRGDWDVVLTNGPVRVDRPDGKPLCVYLPGVMRDFSQDERVYQVLHSLRGYTTNNRGAAGGTPRIKRGTQKRSYASWPVASAMVGVSEATSIYRYCRLTAWTGEHLPEWEALHPMLREVARHFAERVPNRFRAQMEAALQTRPEWVIAGTPFTTLTVNNSYSTGVHQDGGDLEAGFSTLTVLRRGPYTGGQLCFPAYRVAVDMHDGDLLLMDAHDWHGNAAMICACGNAMMKMCDACGAERISVVTYFRTEVQKCSSPDEEFQKALQREVRP